MTTPMDERDGFSFPAFEPNHPAFAQDHTPDPAINRDRRESDEDGTLTGSGEHTHRGSDHVDDHEIDRNHLRVETSYTNGPDHLKKHARGISPRSPSAVREESRRLEDDLEMLRAERAISQMSTDNLSRSRSLGHSRSRTAGGEPVDDFDIDTTPIHEKTKVYQPPAHPTTKFAKLFKKIHNSSWLVRYFFYITPVTLLILVPLLIGALLFNGASVGGVQLLWFSIWLEIIWLTLWAGRILAKCIPYPLGMVSSLFTNNSKKWRDLGKSLEVPATLFFWWLAVEISFLPTMTNHHIDGNKGKRSWEGTANKIIVSIFVGCILNFIEKIIIQLIAISFHLRTYADRIEMNKFQIGSLVKLYMYSKEMIAMEDSEFEHNNGGPSGTRTPMQYVSKVGNHARTAFTKVGDVAGKVAGDFTGRAVVGSTHPHQVILQLLNSTSGSQVLARRLYRTFSAGESETVLSDDLRPAFDNDEEADAAFTMFDKDLNGDISMEELEAVCVEIGRERKAITASLKDLDSVVSKLDDVLVFIVIVITILVFISLISTSASTALTSAGSSVLALSWLFSATAQEFLQSLVFVFVKHPFDVGDRVHIYGNTGSALTGDDYFVKEIALLYTEFKKMEGHVVQAPNSYLNTLFILNQRRSGGLAEAVPVTIKFGTTLEQIESLRNRLVEFVSSENREYQKNVLTELTTIYEAHSISLNVVFFYKSSWQNELLRLQRRNKFICAMMVSMQELGIEGPRMRLPGQKEDIPLFFSGAYPAAKSPGLGPGGITPDGPGPRSGSLAREEAFVPDVNSTQRQPSVQHGAQHSILRNRNSTSRMRGESLGQMGKRVDFSLGMSSISSGADFGDVYDDPKPRLPSFSVASPSRERTSHDTSDRGSLSRITSRDSAKTGQTMSSDQDSTRTHRNRFFNRGRSRLGAADDGTGIEDLEAGVRTFTAADMPDIPEASNTGVDQAPAVKARRGTVDGPGRTESDAKSGMVSSQAVAKDEELPQSKDFRRSMSHK